MNKLIENGADNRSSKLYKISLWISGIRIAISAFIYFAVFLFGSGGWAENRVFGYTPGILNFPWMIVIIILNVKAGKRVSGAQNKKIKWLADCAWLALIVVAIFTCLIITFQQPNK